MAWCWDTPLIDDHACRSFHYHRRRRLTQGSRAVMTVAICERFQGGGCVIGPEQCGGDARDLPFRNGDEGEGLAPNAARLRGIDVSVRRLLQIPFSIQVSHKVRLVTPTL
jgi:hypothetical protein